MEMRALFLNCMLKKSPQVSNTQALFDKAVNIFKDLGVESRRIRVVDDNIPFWVSSNEGEGDKWSFVLEQIRSCDTFIIGILIWFGVLSSVVKMLIERLDGIHLEGIQKPGNIHYTVRLQE
jgi:multimeric flavodoxin WrbA